MRRASLVALGFLLLGCRDTPESDERALQRTRAKLDEVERHEAADKLAIAEAATDAHRLRLHADLVVTEWESVTQLLDGTTRTYEEAVARGGLAANDYSEARANYDKAAARYRQVSYVLIAAAASELMGSRLCGTAQSTQRFRRQLRTEGADLDGLDVDHVWPRALGGADHPLNYQLLESSVNRSLGADALAKLSNWPLATLQGIAVSALVALQCG